jgi:murein DD-endopeptidase MepM/ murein hydrolase activator NlpD
MMRAFAHSRRWVAAAGAAVVILAGWGAMAAQKGDPATARRSARDNAATPAAGARRSSGLPAGEPAIATPARRASGRPKQTGTTRKAQPKARPTPSSPSAKKKKDSQIAAERRAVETTSAVHHLPSLQVADPYGFWRFFDRWWSLTRVEVDWEHASRWLHEASRAAVVQLEGMQADVAGNYERRRINARRATVALYLMGRLRQQSAAIPPAPLAWHAIALRKAACDDATAAQAYAALDERLRVAQAQAVADLSAELTPRAFEESRSDDLPALTVPTAEIVARWNDWLLEQSYPAGMSDILAAAWALARAERQRVALASLAPPAPDVLPAYWPLVGEDVPLPVEPLPTPRRTMTHEKIAAPATQAVTLRVGAAQPVRCVADGTVKFAGAVRGLEQVVIVEHEAGRLSVYALLGEPRVKTGQRVPKGAVVGVARSAPDGREVDLLFEVREGENSVAPRLLLGDRDPRAALLRGD